MVGPTPPYAELRGRCGLVVANTIITGTPERSPRASRGGQTQGPFGSPPPPSLIDPNEKRRTRSTSDHDTVDAVSEARRLGAGRKMHVLRWSGLAIDWLLIALQRHGVDHGGNRAVLQEETGVRAWWSASWRCKTSSSQSIASPCTISARASSCRRRAAQRAAPAGAVRRRRECPLVDLLPPFLPRHRPTGAAPPLRVHLPPRRTARPVKRDRNRVLVLLSGNGRPEDYCCFTGVVRSCKMAGQPYERLPRTRSTCHLAGPHAR